MNRGEELDLVLTIFVEVDLRIHAIEAVVGVVCDSDNAVSPSVRGFDNSERAPFDHVGRAVREVSCLFDINHEYRPVVRVDSAEPDTDVATLSHPLSGFR